MNIVGMTTTRRVLPSLKLKQLSPHIVTAVKMQEECLIYSIMPLIGQKEFRLYVSALKCKLHSPAKGNSKYRH